MDTVSIRSVYSKEANEEAEQKIKEKVNFLDGQGNLVRDVGKEAMLTMYILTMD